MLEFVGPNAVLVGPSGSLAVPPGDEITLKFAMLFEGRCGGLGPLRALFRGRARRKRNS